MLGGKSDQALFDGTSGGLGGFAVEVGARGGGCGRGIGHFAGIGRGGGDAIDINLQFLRHYLRHFGKQTLTHFRATVIQLYAAIGVDVEQGTGLI